MLRFKQFTGAGADLEAAVNAWLEEFEPEVTQMVQSAERGGGHSIAFLYEESFRGQERRLSAQRGASFPGTAPVPPDAAPDEPLEVRADPPRAPGT